MQDGIYVTTNKKVGSRTKLVQIINTNGKELGLEKGCWVIEPGHPMRKIENTSLKLFGPVPEEDGKSSAQP